jgi:hypothetical protein
MSSLSPIEDRPPAQHSPSVSSQTGLPISAFNIGRQFGVFSFTGSNADKIKSFVYPNFFWGALFGPTTQTKFAASRMENSEDPQVQEATRSIFEHSSLDELDEEGQKPTTSIQPEKSIFNLGPMSREEVQKVLRQWPEDNVGVVRYSESQRNYVISYKIGNKIKHDAIDLPLEKIMNVKGIKRLLLPKEVQSLRQEKLQVATLTTSEQSQLPENSLFNHGDLSGDEAESMLTDQSLGVGILRYSSKAEDLVLSYAPMNQGLLALDEIKVKHVPLKSRNLQGLTLGEVMKKLGVQQLVRPLKQEVQTKEVLENNRQLESSPFNHGNISREEADDLLYDQALRGKGLLRYNPKINCFIFSYHPKLSDVIEHIKLKDSSLEEEMAKAEIAELISPKKKEEVIEEKKLEKADQEVIEATELQEQENVSKYDRQIILNLGSGKSAEGLNAKARHQGLPSKMIDLREADCDFSDLSRLTSGSRVYLIGHCKPGRNYIVSDEGVRVTVDDYVNMLKQVTALKNPSLGQKIKISVVACYAAVDGEHHKSFAYQLSQALDKAGIPAEVLARTDIVSRWRGKPEEYKKFVGGKHHAEGSKLVFTTENGQTTVHPFQYSQS